MPYLSCSVPLLTIIIIPENPKIARWYFAQILNLVFNSFVQNAESARAKLYRSKSVKSHKKERKRERKREKYQKNFACPAVPPFQGYWDTFFRRLVHIYIPRNRTPRGFGSLAARSYIALVGFGSSPLPRFPHRGFIISQAQPFVKYFFNSLFARWRVVLLSQYNRLNLSWQRILLK